MSLLDVKHLSLDEILKLENFSIYGKGSISEFLINNLELNNRKEAINCIYDSFSNCPFHHLTTKIYKGNAGSETIVICSMYWVEIYNSLTPDDQKKAIVFDFLIDGKLCLISEEHKFIYVKNPRVASTAIQKLCIENNFKNKIINLQKAKENGYKTFSVVKSPEQRFLSTFNLVFKRKERIPLSCISPMLSELEITISSEVDIFEYLNKIPRSKVDQHFVSQYDFIGSEIDYLTKIDNLYSFLTKLNREFSLFESIPKNLFQYDISREEQTNSTQVIERIRSYYFDDINLYSSLY